MNGSINYIAEIKAFYDWLQLNPLSPDAQALWHALMHFNNKCAVQIEGVFYWRKEFTVPNTTLQSVLAFSRTQLDRMRNELIQAGRIVYTKGKGSKAGKYSIIPFDTHIVSQTVDTQYVTQSVTQPVTQTEHKTGTISILCNIMCTLINNNKQTNNLFGVDGVGVEEEEEEAPDNLRQQVGVFAAQLFKRYMGRQPLLDDEERIAEYVLVPDLGNKLMPMLDQDHADLLEYAFKVAANNGVRSWNYINGVLDRLEARGIKTLEDAFNYDINR